MKRPASQWYWADWLRDPGVRASSLAARGLWMDMLALMHAGKPYGHLTVGEEPIKVPELARMVGESPAKVTRLLAELERHDVFSRTDDGTIYSRRLVRDEHIRTVRAEAGKLGGNPNLDPPTLVNHPPDNLVNQTGEQKPTPSSSTASASAVASANQSDSDSSARERLLEKLDDEYRGDVRAFLTSLGGWTRQTAWCRNFDAKLTGLHPPMVTPSVLGAAVRQLVANGDRPNWKLFEGYLRGVDAPPPPRNQSRNGLSPMEQSMANTAKIFSEET